MIKIDEMVGNRFNNIWMIFVFVLMMFWDVLDKIMPYSQFALLILVLTLYVIINKSIVINKYFLILFLLILIHGIINSIFGRDSINLLIKQLGSIGISYIAYDTFISKESSKRIMQMYFNSAFIMSVFGIIIQIINIVKGTFYYRMMCLYNEPSFFCYFLAPVVCLILFSILLPNECESDICFKYNKIKSSIILFAYFCTFSSIAYIGVLIIALLVFFKKGTIRKKISILFFVIVFAATTYLLIPAFRIRVNDTLSTFSGENIYTTNFSSYTLYNNYQVTNHAVDDSYGLGTGLGSYQLSFDKYSLGVGQYYTPLYNLNREDANSAFLRIFSELGFAGIVFSLFFLYMFRVRKKGIYNMYSSAILTILLLLLFRQGNYTHGGTILYICLYSKIYRESKSEMNKLMKTKNKKRVLLIMPKYFGYEIIIKNHLEEKGFNVHLVFENLEYSNSFYNIMFKILKKYKNELYDFYYKYKTKGISYDNVIVIRGESLKKSVLNYIKTKSPNAKFSMYQWDSVKNNPNALNIADLFDNVSTFDMVDAKTHNWNYRPLFCSYFSKRCNKRKYKFTFISSLHSKRYLILKTLKDEYFTYTSFLYLYSKFFYFMKQKYIDKNKDFEFASVKYIQFKSLKLRETFNVLKNSDIVIDYTHPMQNGFTMRTIESFGNRCKLVTNNKNIRYCDFYNENNIFVYDENNFAIPDSFIQSSYIELDEHIYNEYSVQKWLEDIIG